MKGCRKTQAELAAYFYGDLGEKVHTEVEAHLGRCPQCRSELAELAELLATVDAVAPDYRVEEDAGPEFTDTVLSRIRKEKRETATETAPKAPKAPWWWNLRPRLTAVALAGAAVLSAWLMLEMDWQSLPGGSGPALISGQTAALLNPNDVDRLEEFVVRFETARYLADSETLLLNLADVRAQCDREGDLDISLEKELAAKMVQRKRRLEPNLRDLPHQSAEGLCNDLEDVFFMVSTLENCSDVDPIQMIAKQIVERKLLFKIAVLSKELT